ncbi:MAG: tRNA epoxyqueuosine(34) reductase QueG [Chitinophagaceae bacterium]|nr:MAG: tRNA epoxyqueuosine(34) reductase QueG [Chitinophagaceae bacterium]
MTDPRASHTKFVKSAALELGFDYCGIAKAGRLDEDALRLEKWLGQGMHGSMTYMENHFDKRVDPTLLVPGAKSVITVLKNYYTPEQVPEDGLKISKYAMGNDYHEVIRAQMNELLDRIRGQVGEISGRGFVDSAPVMERSWAKRAGLGWVGKNGNLITRTGGSFFFIATLITDLELLYDDPFAADFCGSCTKCIDACPTGAILPNRVVNGSQCISYFTIELKELLIPSEMKGQFDNWAFGCDTCQDVCPWNRFSKPHQEEAFNPLPELLNLSTREWEAVSEESFRKIFRHSPVKRAKWQGLQRNIRFLKDNGQENS